MRSRRVASDAFAAVRRRFLGMVFAALGGFLLFILYWLRTAPIWASCNVFLLLLVCQFLWHDDGWWHQKQETENRFWTSCAGLHAGAWLFAVDSPINGSWLIPLHAQRVGTGTAALLVLLVCVVANVTDRSRHRAELSRQPRMRRVPSLDKLGSEEALVPARRKLEQIEAVLHKQLDQTFMPSTFKNFFRARSMVAQERAIISILESCTASELNFLVSRLKLGLLLYKVKNHPGEGRDSRNQLMKLLCRTRLHQLGMHERAYVLHALQQVGTRDLASQQYACQVIQNTREEDLTLLKCLCDTKGDFHSLHKLAYEDVRDPEIREKILRHVQHQGKVVKAHIMLGTTKGKLFETIPWRKILSDVDDTLFSSGGRYPAGCDSAYPHHELYPGVTSFYRELDLGIDGGSTWDPSRGDVGNLVFLSARPRVYRHKMEQHSHERFEKYRKARMLHATPTMLAGSIESGRAFVMGEDFGPMADKKFHNFCEYMELYPEYNFVFIGDNGQADVMAAELVVTRFKERIEAVYIHKVKPLEKTFGYEGAESLVKWRRMGFHFFSTYVGAAVHAASASNTGADSRKWPTRAGAAFDGAGEMRRRPLIHPHGVRRIAAQAVAQFEAGEAEKGKSASESWAALEARAGPPWRVRRDEWWRALNADVDKANELLAAARQQHRNRGRELTADQLAAMAPVHRAARPALFASGTQLWHARLKSRATVKNFGEIAVSRDTCLRRSMTLTLKPLSDGSLQNSKETQTGLVALERDTANARQQFVADARASDPERYMRYELSLDNWKLSNGKHVKVYAPHRSKHPLTGCGQTGHDFSSAGTFESWSTASISGEKRFVQHEGLWFDELLVDRPAEWDPTLPPITEMSLRETSDRHSNSLRTSPVPSDVGSMSSVHSISAFGGSEYGGSRSSVAGYESSGYASSGTEGGAGGGGSGGGYADGSAVGSSAAVRARGNSSASDTSFIGNRSRAASVERRPRTFSENASGLLALIGLSSPEQSGGSQEGQRSAAATGDCVALDAEQQPEPGVAVRTPFGVGLVVELRRKRKKHKNGQASQDMVVVALRAPELPIALQCSSDVARYQRSAGGGRGRSGHVAARGVTRRSSTDRRFFPVDFEHADRVLAKHGQRRWASAYLRCDSVQVISMPAPISTEEALTAALAPTAADGRRSCAGSGASGTGASSTVVPSNNGSDCGSRAPAPTNGQSPVFAAVSSGVMAAVKSPLLLGKAVIAAGGTALGSISTMSGSSKSPQGQGRELSPSMSSSAVPSRSPRGPIGLSRRRQRGRPSLGQSGISVGDQVGTPFGVGKVIGTITPSGAGTRAQERERTPAVTTDIPVLKITTPTLPSHSPGTALLTPSPTGATPSPPILGTTPAVISLGNDDCMARPNHLAAPAPIVPAVPAVAASSCTPVGDNANVTKSPPPSSIPAPPPPPGRLSLARASTSDAATPPHSSKANGINHVSLSPSASSLVYVVQLRARLSRGREGIAYVQSSRIWPLEPLSPLFIGTSARSHGVVGGGSGINSGGCSNGNGNNATARSVGGVGSAAATAALNMEVTGSIGGVTSPSALSVVAKQRLELRRREIFEEQELVGREDGDIGRHKRSRSRSLSLVDEMDLNSQALGDGKPDKPGSSIGGTLLNMLRHGFGYGATPDAAEPAPASQSPATASAAVDTPRGAKAEDTTRMVDWSVAVQVDVADPFYWCEDTAAPKASPLPGPLLNGAVTPFYWSQNPTAEVGVVVNHDDHGAGSGTGTGIVANEDVGAASMGSGTTSVEAEADLAGLAHGEAQEQQQNAQQDRQSGQHELQQNLNNMGKLTVSVAGNSLQQMQCCEGLVVGLAEGDDMNAEAEAEEDDDDDDGYGQYE